MLSGEPYYFPVRQPKTLTFAINENDPNDPYAKLYRDDVVHVIANLSLPRYGLANFLIASAEKKANVWRATISPCRGSPSPKTHFDARLRLFCSRRSGNTSFSTGRITVT